jgi:hypothetical protein
MAHAKHDHPIEPPKELKIAPTFFYVGIALLIIGAIAFAVGLGANPARAWRGYIIGFWFTMGIAVTGPFFIATQYLVKAGWSVSIRRIPEAFGAYLYPTIVLGAVALLGAPKLFKWMKPTVVDDPITSEKLGFLNFEGLVLTTLASTIAWAVLYFLIRKNSLDQDEDGDANRTRKNIWLSAFYLLAFVIGFSFMSWYWMMSVDDHWYSTMFSVYAFAGAFQSSLALTAIILVYCLNRGLLGGVAGTQQLHDIGKLVFAFTVFYAYIAFSQFLLIWYANIPEAAAWYVHRLEKGWGFYTLLLPFLKFIIPFLLLLPQDHKKNKNNILVYVSMLLIAMQLYEIWYWIAPYPGIDGNYSPMYLYELTIPLGFIGLFMVVVGRSLAGHRLVPIKDPFLHESIPHEHHHHGSSQADLEAQVENVVREH